MTVNFAAPPSIPEDLEMKKDWKTPFKRLFGGIAWVSLIVGCDFNPRTYPVSGKITFEGQPLVGGTSIQFVPTSGQNAMAAGGSIQEDGSFVLRTYGEADGAVAGEHRVEIRQKQVLKPAVFAPTTPDADGREPEFSAPLSPEVRVAPHDIIPDRYSTPASPLKATVEKKSQEINFDLKREIKAQATN